MYELNKQAKIIVDEKEVYYGTIIEIDLNLSLVKLLVIDWRDRETLPHRYNIMVVPISKFTIKYLDVKQ